MDFFEETRIDGSPLPDGKLVAGLISHIRGTSYEIGETPSVVDNFQIGDLTLDEYFILCLMSQARQHGIKFVSLTNRDLMTPKKKVRNKTTAWSHDYMFAWEAARYYSLNAGCGNGWGEWGQYQINGKFNPIIHGVWDCFEEKKFSIPPFGFHTKISQIEQFEKDVRRNQIEKYDPFKRNG
jgi:hypothetical protein